jgi:hypothetical protein
VAYRFTNGSRTRVTVFVYPVPADVRVSESPQDWVTREGEKFPQTFPMGVERGWYEDYRLAFARPDPLTVDTLVIPGYVVAAATRARGEVRVELEYLYLVRDTFTKVRATVPEQGWERTDVPVFAKDLAASLARQ